MAEIGELRSAFATRLFDLMQAAGLTSARQVEAESRRAPIAPGQPVVLKNGTVSGWIRPESPSLPSDFGLVARFVDVCLHHARRTGRRVPAALGDRKAWRTEYDRVQASRSQARRRFHPAVSGPAAPAEPRGSAVPGRGAEARLRTAAQAGNVDAMWRLAWLLERTGRAAEAEGWLWRAAESGDPDAIWELAGTLERSGRVEEAERWLRTVAADGNPHAVWQLSRLFERTGRVAEALALWQRSAEAGDHLAIRQVAGILERAGRVDEARSLLRPLALRDDIHAQWQLAELMERSEANADAAGPAPAPPRARASG